MYVLTSYVIARSLLDYFDGIALAYSTCILLLDLNTHSFTWFYLLLDKVSNPNLWLLLLTSDMGISHQCQHSPVRILFWRLQRRWEDSQICCKKINGRKTTIFNFPSIVFLCKYHTPKTKSICYRENKHKSGTYLNVLEKVLGVVWQLAKRHECTVSANQTMVPKQEHKPLRNGSKGK